MSFASNIRTSFCKSLYSSSLTSLDLSRNYTCAQTFDLGNYMRTKISRINEALDEAVPLRRPLKLHKSMRYSLLAPGKRACSVLTIVSSELVGGDESAAMPCACAMEMFVASTQIHDDLPCIDNDDTRRGRPSNHSVFGEDVAVLTGDALLFLAFQHVAACAVGLRTDRVVRMVTEFGKAFGPEGMTAGQVMDKESEGKAVGLEELNRICVLKATPFFEVAAVCGAIAGGGGEGEVERLRRYGRCVGLAYQVVNDITDVTCTSEELGKTAGNDLASDKATYPKLMGIDGARKYAREMVEQAEEELRSFDPIKAAPLYHFARTVANRKGKGSHFILQDDAGP